MVSAVREKYCSIVRAVPYICMQGIHWQLWKSNGY